MGNVSLNLHLHSPGHPVNLVEEIQIILESLAEAYPSDPFIFGGDFNCHFFSNLRDSHELQFRHLARCFSDSGFSMYPSQEEPFTFRSETSFVTIDYVFARGVSVSFFEVADRFSSVTQHRLLFLQFEFPSTPDPHTDMELSPAWGAAYWKSRQKQGLLRAILQGLATKFKLIETTHCVQTTYDQVANAFTLCTKRTIRKPYRQRWESELTGEDSSRLQRARANLLAEERRLRPGSSTADFADVSRQRSEFRDLLKLLKKRAVQNLHKKNRRAAENHTGTWKLLSSFKKTEDQPQVAPSVIFDHYKAIASANRAPLKLRPLSQIVYGPLTREDSLLVDDVQPEEADNALKKMNKVSAPGPDGLTAKLIPSAFGTANLVCFLAQIFTACFRRAFTPEQWRRAENFVLWKGKEEKTNVNSFRAISLTQLLAKAYERILFNRLWKWFTSSTLF